LKGDYGKAVLDSSEAIRLNPNEADAFYRRGEAWYMQGEYPKAIDDYRQAIKLDQNHAQARSAYAWLLSTCVSDKYRDGKRAIELAQEASELAIWKNPHFACVLAASYAEAGDFESAVIWQEDALRLLEREKTEDFLRYRNEYQDMLDIFKKKKPYRD
jgi:tetratricopeptide (TPR) repeat protein